jgi:hypothetical protein
MSIRQSSLPRGDEAALVAGTPGAQIAKGRDLGVVTITRADADSMAPIRCDAMRVGRTPAERRGIPRLLKLSDAEQKSIWKSMYYSIIL